MTRRSDAAFLLAAAGLGLVLRLAFGLGYWTNEVLTRDEHEYLSLARSLTAGRGFVYDDALPPAEFMPFGRAPGYPAFVALAGGGRTMATSTPTGVKIAQSIAGAIGVVIVGVLAGRLAGRRALRVAAVLAAVYPPLVWIAAYVYSEALFWPIGLAVVWLFDRAATSRDGAVKWAALCGVVAGAAILIRPALLLFMPLAALWLLRQRRIGAAMALTIGTLAIVAPWTARNYAHHGKLVLVASDGGVTFWTGNHPLAIGEGDMAAVPAIKVANHALRDAHPGLDEEAMEPVYYREALAWIRANPATWIALEAKKLFYTFVPIGPSYRLHSRLYYVATLLSYLPMLALGVAGVIKLGGARRASPGLWLMAAAAIAVCLVFFPQERFRIPTLDPTLLICAGALLASRRAGSIGPPTPRSNGPRV